MKKERDRNVQSSSETEDGTCFDADQPSGWIPQQFAEFVSDHVWHFARTMPHNPHEYTLRRNASKIDFDATVRYIREHGVLEQYRGFPYKTLYFAEHKYWTMGSPLHETILINRKPQRADQLVEIDKRSRRMERRAYGAIRDIVERLGGTMTYKREGFRHGAWVISMRKKQATVEARGNQSFPELDRLYVPLGPNPTTWNDYSSELVPDAKQRLLSLLR
jgi:16S rRNA C967 or C1407 C5-methylase (RsmB/RsmF family)